MNKYSLDGTSCTTGTNKKTLNYGQIGNMTMKSDVCSTANCMAYGENGAGPHQLTSILGSYNGVTNPTFSYDANGNMTGGAGRSFTWTSFNMAATITQGTTSAAIAYGAEHQRYKMCSPDCTNPTATTLYLYDPATGGASELYTSGSTATWRDYIVADGQIVAERFDTAGTVDWRYIVGDHLGSITTITRPNDAVKERDSYDAWGKRRNPDATDDPTCSIGSLTTRGYTQQEMIDSDCLINMNARLYDPTLGQFLSADTIVPDPINLLSFNRYSYVNNDPMNAVDPTGHVPCYGCNMIIINPTDTFATKGLYLLTAPGTSAQGLMSRLP